MNKVISASAGSGKTYTIAQEFISLLVKNLYNPKFHFKNILVITFTRKAAAEIRTKVFFMLSKLTKDKNPTLIKEIEQKVNFILNEQIQKDLEVVFNEMRSQKNKLRISTIDSFINQIFKTMIAPIMKLSKYTIDNDNDYKVQEKIIDGLLKDEYLPLVKRMNCINPKKDIKLFGKSLIKIIDYRLLFHLLCENYSHYKSLYSGEPVAFDSDLYIKEKETSIKAFKEIFTHHCIALNNLLLANDKPYSSYLTKNATLALNNKIEDISNNNFLKLVHDFLENKLLDLNLTTIKELSLETNIKLYNGTYFRKNPPSNAKELKQAFLRFVYYHYVLPETMTIYEFQRAVSTIYDDIKKTSGVLSYSDISWFTYKYLYDEKYSMIDKDPTGKVTVQNQFYEFLTVKNQHILIDEFQDTSVLQFLILSPILSELSSGYTVHDDDQSVIVVGDEKQSIYGWRGAEKSLLKTMNVFLNAQQCSLLTNYRSTPEIVNFVNNVFKDDNFIKFHSPCSFDNWEYSRDVVSNINDVSGSVRNHFYDYEGKKTHERFIRFVEDVVKPVYNSDPAGDTAILVRSNKELDAISALLIQENIPHVKESSSSIFEHDISKYIIYLFNYIQFKDFISLFKFLRSDVVLINSKELKEIAIFISENKELPRNKEKSHPISIINEIYDEYHKKIDLQSALTKQKNFGCTIDSLSYHSQPTLYDIDMILKTPLILAKKIIDSFKFLAIFHNETEIKNLNTFMNIISDFMSDSGEYTTNLEGFILFAEEMKNKETSKQETVIQKGAIQLMTIHKSKGLGFDTVLVYIETDQITSSSTSFNVDYAIDDKSYSQLKWLHVSLNYNFVLKELFTHDYEEIKHKKTIDEINTLYVALTRAKKNLSVYWVKKTLKDESKDISIKKWVRELAKSYASTNPTQLSSANYNQPPAINHPMITHHYIDIPRQYISLYKNKVSIKTEHLKYLFIHKKSVLIGNAAHLYLSFIKYDREEEHQFALINTINKYGNILSQNEIKEVVSRVKICINNNQSLFCSSYDKVFNEWACFDDKNNQYRIDRFIVNTTEKKAMVIDFKTGGIEDAEQIERYIKILYDIPALRNEGYFIEGQFVVV